MVSELKRKKSTFEPEMWNPETVLLGGLGKEPELDSNIDPLKIYAKKQERPKTRTKKVDLFRPIENENNSSEK